MRNLFQERISRTATPRSSVTHDTARRPLENGRLREGAKAGAASGRAARPALVLLRRGAALTWGGALLARSGHRAGACAGSGKNAARAPGRVPTHEMGLDKIDRRSSILVQFERLKNKTRLSLGFTS